MKTHQEELRENLDVKTDNEDLALLLLYRLPHTMIYGKEKYFSRRRGVFKSIVKR